MDVEIRQIDNLKVSRTKKFNLLFYKIVFKGEGFVCEKMFQTRQ